MIRTLPIFHHFGCMNQIEALRSDALAMNDRDRATLATELLYSLPATLLDEDDGLSEAIRRDKELTENDSCRITWDELKKSVGR